MKFVYKIYIKNYSLEKHENDEHIPEKSTSSHNRIQKSQRVMSHFVRRRKLQPMHVNSPKQLVVEPSVLLPRIQRIQLFEILLEQIELRQIRHIIINGRGRGRRRPHRRIIHIHHDQIGDVLQRVLQLPGDLSREHPVLRQLVQDRRMLRDELFDVERSGQVVSDFLLLHIRIGHRLHPVDSLQEQDEDEGAEGFHPLWIGVLWTGAVAELVDSADGAGTC